MPNARYDNQGVGEATYQRGDGEPVSTAVVEAVADYAGTDVTDLDPLYETVDPDALDRLFEPLPDGTGRRGSVTLHVDDYAVTVDAEGEVTVRDA